MWKDVLELIVEVDSVAPMEVADDVRPVDVKRRVVKKDIARAILKPSLNHTSREYSTLSYYRISRIKGATEVHVLILKILSRQTNR